MPTPAPPRVSVGKCQRRAMTAALVAATGPAVTTATPTRHHPGVTSTATAAKAATAVTVPEG